MTEDELWRVVCHPLPESRRERKSMFCVIYICVAIGVILAAIVGAVLA